MGFESLADVHVPLEELGGRNAEQALVEVGRAKGPACACVLGGRGNGKSSLIAAAVGALRAQTYFCPRIQATDAMPTAREDFVLHAGREILQVIERSSSKARDLAATSTARTTGGHSLGSHGAQIRSAAQQVVSDQGAAERFAAMDELAAVSLSAGRPMVLVVEDTDPYMPAPGGAFSVDEAAERAKAFINGPLMWLSREAPCPSLVAVHDGHLGLLDSSVETVTLPPFTEPALALEAIALRYLRQHDIRLDRIEDLIESKALEFLASSLAERSLRDVLRVLSDAAERAVEERDEAALITYSDVSSV